MSANPEPDGPDDVDWNSSGNDEFLDDLRYSDEVEIDLSNARPCDFDAAGVRVVLAPECMFRAARSTVQRIGETVVQHLSRLPEHVDGPVNLLITVREAEGTIGKIARVFLEVTGAIGQFKVAFSVRASRSGSRLHGGVFSFVFHMIFEALGSLKKQDTPPLQICFDQCIAQTCLNLDCAIERSESLTATLYRLVDRGRWLVALLGAGLVGYTARVNHRHEEVHFPFVMGLISFFAIASFLQGVNGAWAPRSFYRETPRGRCEAARLGVQNVWLHRLKSLVIAVVFGVGCVFIAMMVGLIRRQ